MIAENLKLLKNHVERHNALMIIATSIITLVALLFTVFWEYDTNNINHVIDHLYLGGNIFFLATSFALTALLLISRFKKLKGYFLLIAIHVYVFFLIAWATLACTLDLCFGFSPMFYMLLFAVVAGLYVVEPLFFMGLVTISITIVLSISLQHNAAFFSDFDGVENIVTFIGYFVVIAIAGGEHFGITITNYKIEKRIEQLTYFDDLTGLLNERSYLQEIEKIDKNIQDGKLSEYAIILMDLNNIKVTNDTYGHRYGCHLIVRCGKTLPNYFKTSKLFHIGGDEFVVIVYDEDYQNLDKILETMASELSYSHIEFEGQELIFSLAHGVSRYESGMRYKDVLQKADDEMYINKKELKSKHGLKGR